MPFLAWLRDGPGGAGADGPPTDDEAHAAAVAALEDRLATQPPPDAETPRAPLTATTLARYLRARKWVVDDAEKQLRGTLAWRARVGADAILDDPIDPNEDVYRALCPRAVHAGGVLGDAAGRGREAHTGRLGVVCPWFSLT